ncbi:MAG: hypothetical protein IT423_13315, partial [Pirellulaceae bacterium]|nr:hypothetical protein [Pirellulaceae bacterium]
MQFEQSEPRRLLTADFQLVGDMNLVTNGFKNPSPVVQAGSIGYFTAYTDALDWALYKTDGTSSGTMLVKDISPGFNPNIVEMTDVGGVLFFVADDGTHGAELWRSNGTPEGTFMVKDIRPGSDGSFSFSPRSLTNVNGTLFLSANSSDSFQLWKSDGTTAGTVLVKPPNSASGANTPMVLTNVNGVLYFSATNTNFGREVWKSDGTAAGTVMVADVAPGSVAPGLPAFDSNPFEFTAVGGTVYFATQPQRPSGDTPRYELWRTNGTAFGTFKLKTEVQTPLISRPNWGIRDLVNVNNTLYFVSNTELHKSDGTVAGTNIVRQIYDDGFGGLSAGSEVNRLINVSGMLYFTANSSQGFELFKSDGTFAGTVIVADLNEETGSHPFDLTNVNGQLYFTAQDEVDRWLWRSDGTESGTVRLKRNVAGPSPSNLANLGGTLLFSSRDPNFAIEHLWKSNGTVAGTVPVREIDSGDFNPTALTNVNGKLFYAANDGVSGNELWSSDGNVATRVADISGGPISSNPNSLVNANGRLYFTATRAFTGAELWTSDGTEAGTEQVADIRAGVSSSAPAGLVNIGSVVYFTADNGINGRELWRVSGRTPTLVKDIRPGVASSGITGLTVVGNTLFFQANDGTNGPELWKSDGTAAGTVMVRNIRFGSAGSSPNNLAVVGGFVYFQATDGLNGRELWRSDGTPDGTIMVKNINSLAGTGSYPTFLTNVNGTLYFRASDHTTGVELWKSNGTSAGTIRVLDISTGPTSSSPSGLTNVNGKLYFAVSDVFGDVELWATNGSARSTVRVRDINSIASFSLTNVNGLLYFSASDSINGRELYKSDGTFLGTTRISSFAPGPASGSPVSITTVGTQVFLSAVGDFQGRELWVQNVLEATPGNDVFNVKVTASGDAAVSYAPHVLATPHLLGIFPASQELRIDGLGGSDALSIEATPGADLFDVSLAGIRTNGSLLKTANIESRTLVGLAGDDTYRFNVGTESLGVLKLDETGGGTDTIDMSPTSTIVNLNLNNSLQQNVTTNLALQFSSSAFENAIGGQGNDVLVGNAKANVLRGQAGNDTLVGGLGDDILMGEAGNDTLNGAAGSDSLQGGPDDDRYLFDVNLNPELDQLLELPGEGSDTLDFGLHANPITLNLGLTTVQAVHTTRTIQLSAIDSFENAIGGSASDTLTGTAGPNSLTGGGGSDDLRGGPGDDTYVFGNATSAEADQILELVGAGLDTISFASLSIPVTLDLGTTAIQNVHINRTLKLSSAVTFENAVGGLDSDDLTGNGLANVLVGNGGSDRLTGLGRRDLLIGGLGADTLDGGIDEDLL